MVLTMESMSTPRTETKRPSAIAAVRLGERLRQLRVAAGLTQSELAGDRFSKEYVSQIERGKTRPTAGTVEWLARRLGVDVGFLSNGVSTEQRHRVEAGLARAEALVDAGQFEEALAAYAELGPAVAGTGAEELEVRAACGEWRGLISTGQVRESLDRLGRARAITEGAAFSDVDRAEVLWRMGASRYLLSSTTSALALLNQALELAERSGYPCDLVKANILHYRSRCYRRQRDYEAAREDVELALELAQSVQEPRTLGHIYFQASMLAERSGHWVLARSYAEKAKACYEEIADQLNVGKLLNNLGGLNFMLGHPEEAKGFLKSAFATALDVGNDADAAEAVSSLAQVHLRTGEPELAEQQARQALKLFAGHADQLDGIGGAQVVLGRALLEQGRLNEAGAAFGAAEAAYDQLSSASHRAAAWIAQGDLAAARGDDGTAARLFRRAAEALQDVRF
jgi:transcriptional regulator with XRE-family HTH domain/Tfp pilus assembly protein PilF